MKLQFNQINHYLIIGTSPLYSAKHHNHYKLDIQDILRQIYLLPSEQYRHLRPFDHSQWDLICFLFTIILEYIIRAHYVSKGHVLSLRVEVKGLSICSSIIHVSLA